MRLLMITLILSMPLPPRSNRVRGNMEASGAGVDERMRTDSCRGKYWLQANRWDWVESRQVKVCCSRLWGPTEGLWVRIRCGLVTVSQ